MKAKHFYLILLGIVSLTMVWSCKEEEKEPYLKSADNGATITADGNAWSGWSTILQSNIDLSNLRTSCSASWCTANLSAMGNDYQLQVFAEDNPSQSERKAIISVQSSDGMAAVSFNVIQQPGKPFISFKDGGGDETIGSQAKTWERQLVSNIEFNRLSAHSSDGWCDAKLESSDNGIVLKLDAQENTKMEERKATITIKTYLGDANISFVVTQQSSNPSIGFVDGGEDQMLTAEAQSWKWKVSTNIAKEDIETTSDAEWCTVYLTTSSYTYGELTVKVDKNESITQRNATVEIKSTKHGVSLSFKITQQAGQPVIKFSSSTEGKDQSVAAPAKELVWTLLSNIPYSSLKVTSNESWCKVKIDNSKDNTDIKSYQLTTNIDENMSDKQRQAVVTISSEFYNVSTSFMVTQSASTFSISHTQLGLDRDGGNRTVTITSNASWKAECDADWISLEQTNGYLTVRVKPTTTNRSANITFKDKSTTIITVNQAKYKVGEEYDEGGVTGTVAYIGDDKRYIFKNTGRNEYWYYGHTTLTGYSWSMDDGEHNMQIVKDIPAWYSNFYAFVAVDDLNTGGITGWYLPAIEELNNMRAFVSGTAWSSTHSTMSVYAVYVLDNGVVSSVTFAANLQRGVYAIRKF